MSDYDITLKIGALFPRTEKPEWPMYSYDRPAYVLWNAIAGQLHERGWSDDEIKDWLQSKNARWALDGELGDALRRLGADFALRHLLKLEGDNED